MRKFGLIGYPLGHSFSKGYFTNKFLNEELSGCEYNNYPIDSVDKFELLLRNTPELIGLNVTIPYKQLIIPFLTKLNIEASEIGAVNTIKIIRSDGNIILQGYNTDFYGFEESIKPILKDHHKKALILGTGGASKAVAYVFNRLGISFKYVSRKPISNEILAYEQVTNELLQEYLIIVNTSPLGMYPDIQSCPDIPYHSLSQNHIMYDLIYNPEITLFLKKGSEKGANTINGLPMLHLQAEKAWEIWNS